MKKLAIVHYQPLELYPPVMNLIDSLENLGANTEVYTTENFKNNFKFSSKVDITRFPSPSKGNAFVRQILYLKFVFGVFIRLMAKQPRKILYYETISALPIFLYSVFSFKQASIYIHNHEYLSKDWYQKNSFWNRFQHKLECNYLFKKSQWISQTNQIRLELFKEENKYINTSKLKVLANYPPKKWLSTKTNFKSSRNNEVRFVYVGTVSLDYTYIIEFISWIKTVPNATLDIYTININETTENKLKQVLNNNVRLLINQLQYNEIPKVLMNYDIGLILYKAITVNYKYNETNKLFEYLNCGLEVWFPKEMLGCKPYETNDFPGVRICDYQNLSTLVNNLELFLSNKEDISNQRALNRYKKYFFEDEYKNFINLIN